ncbi:MAG: hypothetical protein RXO24_01020 [Acidilobus sp.]|nr:hypothetical protein [Acidilobus sp.]
MSEERKDYTKVLLDLYGNALEAHYSILHLASATGLGDSERTVIDLATRIVATKDNVVWRAESVANLYLISAAVAGRKPDRRKVRRLLYLARRIRAMAESIDREGRRGNVDLMFQYDKIAERYVKGLIESGKNLMTFYNKARALLSETAELSQELLSEASDNLAAIGILPRKRILEEFVESVSDIGKLSQPIDDNERSEADQ